MRGIIISFNHLQRVCIHHHHLRDKMETRLGSSALRWCWLNRQRKQLRSEFMLITFLFMTATEPPSKWIPFSNLHQDSSMNSIPQSLHHFLAHHYDKASRENLLSDDTNFTYTCKLTNTFARFCVVR